MKCEKESNQWPPEHRAGALSTELRQLMEDNVIYLSSYVTLTKQTLKISTRKHEWTKPL